MPRKSDADEPIAVAVADWSILDGGFVQVPNYWKRFWWPLLGPTAAALWELLLVYSRPDRSLSWPSIHTLAATLGCDRRSLLGRDTPARTDRQGHRHPPAHYPGAFARLLDAGLAALTLTDGRPRYLITIQRVPRLLTAAEVAALPHRLQTSHAKWLEAHGQLVALATIGNRIDSGSLIQPDTAKVALATTKVASATQTELLTERRLNKETDLTGKRPPEPTPPAAWAWSAILGNLRANPLLTASITAARPLRLDGRELVVMVNSTWEVERWMGQKTLSAVAVNASAGLIDSVRAVHWSTASLSS